MTDRQFIKPDRPNPEQIAAWRRMSFEEKLAVADQLRTTALRLREAWLRRQEPGLTDEEIRRRLREYLMYGAA